MVDRWMENDRKEREFYSWRDAKVKLFLDHSEKKRRKIVSQNMIRESISLVHRASYFFFLRSLEKWKFEFFSNLSHFYFRRFISVLPRKGGLVYMLQVLNLFRFWRFDFGWIWTKFSCVWKIKNEKGIICISEAFWRFGRSRSFFFLYKRWWEWMRIFEEGVSSEGVVFWNFFIFKSEELTSRI